MSEYAGSKALAERQIAKKGGDATLRQITESGDAWAPTLTETDTTIKVVDLNRIERDASGTLVGQLRRTLLVSTSAGVTPAKGDKVVIGGTEHEIEDVDTLKPSPDDVTIMHTVRLVT